MLIHVQARKFYSAIAYTLTYAVIYMYMYARLVNFDQSFQSCLPIAMHDYPL